MAPSRLASFGYVQSHDPHISRRLLHSATENLASRLSRAVSLDSNACPPTVLGTNLRYKGPLHENDGGIVSLGRIPPVPDSVWARELRNDLKGKSLIYLYGDAWVHGAEVRGYTCSNLDVALLSEVLGDAPAGTAIVVGHGADLRGAWRIS